MFVKARSGARRLVVRVISVLGAIGIIVWGFAIAYGGAYFYIATLRFPYGSVPLWKSTIIIGLIVAAIVLPLYSGYRLIRFAVGADSN